MFGRLQSLSSETAFLLTTCIQILDCIHLFGTILGLCSRVKRLSTVYNSKDTEDNTHTDLV
jgi:hypothetical protein